MKMQNNLPSIRNESRVMGRPFDLLQSQIDRVFNDFSRGLGMPGFWEDETRGALGGNGGLMPLIDVREEGGRMMITADLPGVEEKDIDITVQDDALIISGERRSEFEERNAESYRSERVFGKFSRTIDLPFAVDPSKVEARFINGVLKLIIDKPAEAQQKKRIPIRH